MTDVTLEQALAFAEEAFRNVDMPALTGDDIHDVRQALQSFLAARLALSAGGGRG